MDNSNLASKYIDSDGRELYISTYDSGTYYYFHSNNKHYRYEFHRLDGPAVIWNSGSYWWI